MDKTYASRVDRWIAVLLVVPPVAGVVTLVSGLLTSVQANVWAGLGVLALFAVILGTLVLPMRYVIGAEALTVRAGLLKFVVRYDRLIAVTPSSNPLSSPALSLRRLRVDYEKGSGKPTFVLISPTDRERFMQDLATASPRHRLDGDRLVS